jgi:hypothetical protein
LSATELDDELQEVSKPSDDQIVTAQTAFLQIFLPSMIHSPYQSFVE